MVSISVVRSQTLLVDDHPLFRSGLAMALTREPDLEVVGEASTADAAVALAQGATLDIAVIDVLLPNASGVSLATQLQELQPGCKLLALSALDEPVMIATMLQAGASGYALKSQPASEIMEAMRCILAGNTYLPPDVSSHAVLELFHSKLDRPIRRLTRREREVFELLIRGRSNDEVAAQLFIARRTVETHRQRILKKLGAHSLLELIRVAAQQGALTHDREQ